MPLKQGGQGNFGINMNIQGSVKHSSSPRPLNAGKEKIQPEYEWVTQQNDESIRYLEHGYPSDLVRWHYHQEYELHYIVETHGKMYIGDYIGNFAPNSLVLVGPSLPHNWVSEVEAGQVIPVRDLVVNFNHKLIENSEAVFPEMQGLRPFWQRAKFGIEFTDPTVISASKALLDEIAQSTGFRRLSRFWTLIELLAASDQYRILSGSSFQSKMDQKILRQMSTAIEYILDNYDSNIAQEDVARLVDMSTTYFSKIFKKTTGHRFIAFVNHYRINKACELLAHSDEPITNICFSVGYNNIANFNRQFFSLKQMTPSDYRKSASDALYR